jgi:8-oxo-dGTP pyrophosphatase MutT (NUDIX family)
MREQPPAHHRTKVLIYATQSDRLLTFSQPDFPEAGLQVPGGTVEPDEEIEEAARREFQEESGLKAEAPFTLLGRKVYRLPHEIHDRHFFHVALLGEYPEAWDTREETPSVGGPPIRFRFGWNRLGEVNLAADMGAFLARLRTRGARRA